MKGGASISVDYVTKILAGAARQGVDLSELFTQHGLSPELLLQPSARVDQSAFIGMLQTVMQATEDEFLGLGRGRRSSPGTFSMMAHAVINCRDLGKAIERSAAFYGMFDFPSTMALIIDGDEAEFRIALPLLDHRQIMIEAVMFLSLRFWSWLIGKPVLPLALEFDFSAPPEAAEFGYLFACPLLFDQPMNRIRIPAELLRRPLVQNALSLSRFLRDSMAELIQGEPLEQDLASQIKVILSRDYGQDMPGFDEVAQRLSMPATTLRRRLREQGTSYREIRDALRRDAACFYLRREDLSIEEIALMMGFSEASSFHRSFRKWTGSTPSAYRQQLFYSTNSK